MNTKRCLRCHKILRADAQECSRCGGHDFSQAARARNTVRLPRTATAEVNVELEIEEVPDFDEDLSFPSNPPASPHRAGHYSGLHPEDLPYQSSFMPVQRPVAPARPVAEPEIIQLSPVVEAQNSAARRRSIAALAPQTLPRQQRSLQRQTPLPLDPYDDAQPEPIVAQQPERAVLPRPVTPFPEPFAPQQHRPGIPVARVLVLLAVLFALIGTGAAAFMVLRSQVPATSQPIPKVTHTAVPGSVPASTPVAGLPRLQLSVSRLDFGTDNAGTITHKTITLTNDGSGELTWQSSTRERWLTLSPDHGAFTKNMTVQISVNRGNLQPKAYTGQIMFTPRGSQPQTLTVTMGVNPPSANLVISNAALAFQGTPAQNPAAQSLSVQNTGGQPLDWNASISTSDGNNWLFLSSTSGHLEAGQSATLTVTANSAGLSVGTYSGTVTLSYTGASATPVSVTLQVSAPPSANLSVQPSSLVFTAIQGQNPAAQSFTITNPGSATLDWGISEDANGQTYLPLSTTHASLAPGGSVTITVTPNVLSAKAPGFTSIITVSDTDSGTTVKSQQVKISANILNEAQISVNQNVLVFNHTSNITSSSALLIITNTGSATLNWSLSINNSSPISWVSVDTTSGSVGPGGSIYVTVACDSSHLNTGTFTATLIISDSDANTQVAPQTVTVQLNVT
ncbi:MAG TPA: choice-of-anchor D domain-containing protein [Ktedonobacteraceae bacterium]|nr:choice-of-anchor D domain-containing protein [Ktedonobacteraceae bacterium]